VVVCPSWRGSGRGSERRYFVDTSVIDEGNRRIESTKEMRISRWRQMFGGGSQPY
jgi:hypothetical protein